MRFIRAFSGDYILADPIFRLRIINYRNGWATVAYSPYGQEILGEHQTYDAAKADLENVSKQLEKPENEEVLSLLRDLMVQGEKIMATQKELAAQLVVVKEKLVKIGAETTTLLAKIDELKVVIETGPVTPELQAAVDALTAQAEVVDQLVADSPPA